MKGLTGPEEVGLQGSPRTGHVLSRHLRNPEKALLTPSSHEETEDEILSWQMTHRVTGEAQVPIPTEHALDPSASPSLP